MLMKLTIKAKGFICIYSSGAEQFRASCFPPAERHPRAPTHVPPPTCPRPRARAHASWSSSRGGRGICQRGTPQSCAPLILEVV